MAVAGLIVVSLLLSVLQSYTAVCYGAESAQVDTSTLYHKVMCGYQGWFRCPGDGTKEGWTHWSRNHNKITRESLTVEMWPDMSGSTAEERYLVPGFTNAKEEPMSLFSSVNPATVQRHFEWMQQYGIDGVFLQRFLVELKKPSIDQVLANVRASAKNTGRVYAICYDLSSMPADQIHDRLINDWKRLIDVEKVTKDKQYLHHNGKPVLFVWGFYEDRFDAAIAHRILDSLKGDNQYSVTLVGGCQWNWRSIKHQEWGRAFRRLDIISPWNVGNYGVVHGVKKAAIDSWKADLAEAKKAGAEYLPVVYPGFRWTNLKGQGTGKATLPRRGGLFMWEQFLAVSNLGLGMAYVAMFDEVDEGTAIFKVTNDPPTQAPFLTYEGLPSDWYLRLVGEGTKLLRGEREAKPELPIKS